MKKSYKISIFLFILFAYILMAGCERKSINESIGLDSLNSKERFINIEKENSSEKLPLIKDKDLKPKLYNFENLDKLTTIIIEDKDFISDWATLAHFMGFAWCGGTQSKLVGENFDLEKIWKDGKVVYVLQAHYDPNDLYSEGYRADERLKMTIENVRFIIDSDSIRFDAPEITNLDPILAGSYTGVNCSFNEESLSFKFNYQEEVSYRKNDSIDYSDEIKLEKNFKIEIPINDDDKYNPTFEFTCDKGWSNPIIHSDKSSLIPLEKEITEMVPAKSQRKVELLRLHKETSLPYTANIYIAYDITLSGFIRWEWNGMKDFPRNRPYANVKFGGERGLNAQNHLEKIYNNRDIDDYSQWDWEKIFEKYKKTSVDSLINKIVNKQSGGIQTGTFNKTDKTETKVLVHLPEPLTENN